MNGSGRAGRSRSPRPDKATQRNPVSETKKEGEKEEGREVKGQEVERLLGRRTEEERRDGEG